MVQRVTMLDPYSRPLLAPLGIVFPFPMFCSKLDSYMKRENKLSAHFTQNGGMQMISYLTQNLPLIALLHLSFFCLASTFCFHSHFFPYPTSLIVSAILCCVHFLQFLGAALPNQQFWSEWPSINSRITPNLKNLFDRIFVLHPSFRCTLRDIARHPWLLSREQLTPDEVTTQMKSRWASFRNQDIFIHLSLSVRCPTGVHPNKEASPRVVTSKLLGGVDQASLRLSLTSNSKTKVCT